jgi:hypothetical protein
MEKTQVPEIVTQTGSLVACSSAPVALINESTMLFFFSALGAIVAALGLIYSIWNGNRNYSIQRQELELRRLELMANGIAHNNITHQPQSESA